MLKFLSRSGSDTCVAKPKQSSMSGSEKSRHRFFPGKIALVIALPFFIAACSTVATAPQATVSSQSAPARTYLEAIDLSGRISVHYQRQGNDEALHGSFTWAQAVGHTVVTLLSPLGQTVAVIDVRPDITTMTQAGSPARAAPDADALAAEVLGWPLPIAGLRGWLQGFAIDTAGRKFVAAPQADSVTTADGWRIRYVSWQDDAQANAPKRIDLERDTKDAGDVAIRIVIDQQSAHQNMH